MPVSGSIGVFTTSRVGMVCYGVSLMIKWVLMWPYITACRLLDGIEALSGVKKKLIGLVCNMCWMIILVIITYLVQEALAGNDGGDGPGGPAYMSGGSQENMFRVRRSRDRGDIPIG